MSVIFFCADFFASFHLNCSIHNLGGVHKPCGPSKGRRRPFFPVYGRHSLQCMVTTQTGIRSMYAGIYQMHTTYLYNLVFTWFVPWWDFSMNIHLHMIMSFSPSYIMQVCWKNLYVVIVLQSKYFDMTLCCHAISKFENLNHFVFWSGNTWFSMMTD